MEISIEDVTKRITSERASDRISAALDLRFVSPEDALPLLRNAAKDSIAIVRVYTAVTLGKQKAPGSFEILIDMLGDIDSAVRAEAAGSLGSLGEKRGFEYLEATYQQEADWLVRYSIVVALGQLKDPRSFDILCNALKSTAELARNAAISALGEIGDPRALEQLFPFISDSSPEVRRRVAQALGKLGDPAAQSALTYLTKDEDSSVCEAAKLALQPF